MACHLAGVETAVATCGTAFGEDHVKLLRRLLHDQDEFRGEVIFTFDGDAAGQKAALRAFADDQQFVTQTFVAVEPDGMDPCELRVGQGRRGRTRSGRPPGAAGRVRHPHACSAATTSTPPRARCGAARRGAPSSPRSRTGRCAPSTPGGWPAGSACRRRPGARRRCAELAGDPDPGQQQRRPPPYRRAASAQDRPAPTTASCSASARRSRSRCSARCCAGPVFDALEDRASSPSPAYRSVRAAIVAAGGTQSTTGGPRLGAAVGDACADDATRGADARARRRADLHRPRGATSATSAMQLATLQLRDVTRRIEELKVAAAADESGREAEGYNKLAGELFALEQYRGPCASRRSAACDAGSLHHAQITPDRRRGEAHCRSHRRPAADRSDRGR